MPRPRFRVQREISVVAPEPASSERPVVFFLPAHDEAPRIAGVLARIPTVVADRPVHVVVIDDGSTDETSAVAAAHGAKVVRHETNRGLGAAVRSGFRAAGEFEPAAVVFCDADGEYDPVESAALVRPIVEGEADYVVGSRFSGVIEHMRPHRRMGNRVLTAWLRFVTRRPITDGQSGYRALSGRAAARAEVVHDYNYAQVLTIELLQAGFVSVEVPITYGFRHSGTSFVRLGRYLGNVVPAVFGLLGAGPSVSPSGRRPPAAR
jgi:glycosyltransferase involved in cell wall biosynthesis